MFFISTPSMEDKVETALPLLTPAPHGVDTVYVGFHDRRSDSNYVLQVQLESVRLFQVTPDGKLAIALRIVRLPGPNILKTRIQFRIWRVLQEQGCGGILVEHDVLAFQQKKVEIVWATSQKIEDPSYHRTCEIPLNNDVPIKRILESLPRVPWTEELLPSRPIRP
ncbi:hypothetical protein [Candidatus Cryosericum terrychapinii]